MPIIESLVDTDEYKLTMGQIALHRHPDTPVKNAFKNRTKKVNLADFIDEGELREELDHIRTLRFKDDEIEYLSSIKIAGKRIFQDDYLEFLRGLQLPEYCLEKIDGTFNLEFPGKWSEAIYWETPALAVVNELYNRGVIKKMSYNIVGLWKEGNRRLQEKISRLKQYLEIRFSDFGTRRRFMRGWQEYVIGELIRRVPKQFIGTSNVFLAMKYNIPPIGTFAHEMDMIYSGIYHNNDADIRVSHNKVIQDWWDEYGYELSIALTDTYGTDFFFRDFEPRQACLWKGLRHDSGDPFEFGGKAIRFYESSALDPAAKLIVFSDGLDVEIIIKLHKHFSGRIQTGFGWGTNLTNDLGIGALSLIIKAVESCGHGTVKLSDNLAKAMGKPEDIERFKRIFGYTGNAYKECRY